jgi:AAA family ATP:ADP antiporter
MRVSVWYLLYALLCAVSLINAATLPTANAHAKALHVEDRTARAAAKLIYTQHAKKQSFVAKAAAGDVKGVGGALFPIAKHELKKFFMMSGMMFFIIYVYTVVRDTKDTLVVSHCGAEAITFLKVYGVLPAAALFMVVYAKISNIFSKRKLFYVTAFPFFAFYALFCFVLYPFRHFLQPAEFGGSEGIGFLFKIIQHWTFSLYYIVSELFGSVGVSVLFWQLANDIVPVEQARRFYPLFGQVRNLAALTRLTPVCFTACKSSTDCGRTNCCFVSENEQR